MIEVEQILDQGRFWKCFRPFWGLFFPIKGRRVKDMDLSYIQWATHYMPHQSWSQVRRFKSYFIFWEDPSILLKQWLDSWQFTTNNKNIYFHLWQYCSVKIKRRVILFDILIEFIIWDFVSLLEFAIIRKLLLNCIIS